MRDSILALKRFAAARPRVSRCDLCALEIGEEHEHLLDPTTSAVRCVCHACAATLPSRRLSSRASRLRADDLDAAGWAALEVPIDLVIVMRDGDGLAHARFPSPAGPVEHPLEPEDARRLGSAIASRGEALIVDRRAGRRAVYRVSLDRAHALTGLVRASWHVGGAAAVERETARYFEELERTVGAA